MVVDKDPFFCGNGCSYRLSLVILNIGDIGRFNFMIDHDSGFFFFVWIFHGISNIGLTQVFSLF